MADKKTAFRISGMTCGHCEKRICGAVRKLHGVKSVAASFPKKRAEVVFDQETLTEKNIVEAIEAEGYKVKGIAGEGKAAPIGKVAPVFLIAIALYFILKYTVGFDFINLIPRIDKSVSLAALFATGLFTSVHCIAMCGGINLSQSVGTGDGAEGKFKKPLLYNLGRIISYTVIGGVAGGIGSVLFINTAVKGVIMLVAAVFMMLMSLSMLGWLPWWLVPRLPQKLSSKVGKAKKGRGPLIVGMLNGLLPCGPLQAMQLYALSTGSVITGALSMLLFSLGTVPLMLGAGLVFSMLKGRFTRGITRVSAVLVFLIAFVMLFNAGALFGWDLNLGGSSQVAQAGSVKVSGESAGGSAPAPTGTAGQAGEYAVAKIQDGVQVVEANLSPSKYPSIMVEKGIPVKFNLKAQASDINGCNGTVEFPGFKIEKELQAGDNIVEFTPDKAGVITYTCWMGMIRGKISVVDKLDDTSVQAAATAPAAEAGSGSAAGSSGASGSCCSGGGQAVKFAGGKIPVDDIAVADIKDGAQEVTVNVDDTGYAPAVLVVQKGVKTKIRFNAKSINSCNRIVAFPEYGGSLDLSAGELETPYITPDTDFTFQCGMNMLHGYVKVVDDLNKIDINAIKDEVSKYKPQSGGGCCG